MPPAIPGAKPWGKAEALPHESLEPMAVRHTG
jgi:hypothetical protein